MLAIHFGEKRVVVAARVPFVRPGLPGSCFSHMSPMVPGSIVFHNFPEQSRGEMRENKGVAAEVSIAINKAPPPPHYCI